MAWESRLTPAKYSGAFFAAIAIIVLHGRDSTLVAAERRADLIPMCHPLPPALVDVQMRLCENGVAIISKVTAAATTGSGDGAPAAAGHQIAERK